MPYWIDAGRAYEHMALYLREQGYVTSMHAALTETSHLALKTAALSLKAMVGSSMKPTVVFRLGVPLDVGKFDTNHSSRPGIDTLMF